MELYLTRNQRQVCTANLRRNLAQILYRSGQLSESPMNSSQKETVLEVLRAHQILTSRQKNTVFALFFELFCEKLDYRIWHDFGYLNSLERFFRFKNMI